MTFTKEAREILKTAGGNIEIVYGEVVDGDLEAILEALSALHKKEKLELIGEDEPTWNNKTWSANEYNQYYVEPNARNDFRAKQRKKVQE